MRAICHDILIKFPMFIYKILLGKQYLFREMINYKGMCYVSGKVPREFYGKWSETGKYVGKERSLSNNCVMRANSNVYIIYGLLITNTRVLINTRCSSV